MSVLNRGNVIVRVRLVANNDRKGIGTVHRSFRNLSVYDGLVRRGRLGGLGFRRAGDAAMRSGGFFSNCTLRSSGVTRYAPPVRKSRPMPTRLNVAPVAYAPCSDPLTQTPAPPPIKMLDNRPPQLSPRSSVTGCSSYPSFLNRTACTSPRSSPTSVGVWYKSPSIWA